jgi:hypothetical protein
MSTSNNTLSSAPRKTSRTTGAYRGKVFPAERRTSGLRS